MRSGLKSTVLVRAARVLHQLEPRVFLAASTWEVAELEWGGRVVQAVANEWIVSLERPARTFDEHTGEVKPRSHRWGSIPDTALERSLQAAVPGIEFGEYLGTEYGFTVKLPAGIDTTGLRPTFSQLAGFVDIEPNLIVSGSSVTVNDTNYSSQQAWHEQIRTNSTTEAAWDYTTGDSSVVVAVLDSGVNYNHEDLDDFRWANPLETPGNGIDDDGNGRVDDVFGYDFISTDRIPLDEHGHGTAIAGIIAGAGGNSQGVAGISWRSRILPVRVLNQFNSGTLGGFVNGIEYVNNLVAAGANVRVINASLSVPGTSSQLQDAVSDAATNGILLVAAAGNDGGNIDSSSLTVFPAELTHDNVITVGSATSTDGRSSFSNYGSTSVDLAAPGEAIYTTVYDPQSPANNSYGSSQRFGPSDPTIWQISGTSFAAPMVAGAAALLFSYKPDATVEDVRDAILNNVDVVSAWSGLSVTGGRLNVFKAIQAFSNSFGGFSRVVIGDQSGASASDSFEVRPKSGDSSTVEVVRNSVVVTTTNNANSRRVGIFALGANDTVTVADGVNARLYISGGAGADSLQGGNYLDTIYAGTGNDTVSGGGGADLIYGQGGNDRLNGDGLFGSSGNDTIFGDAGNDTIYGNGGDDSITGGSGTDYLYGDAGNDTIRASDGITDYYNGGSGTNVLDIDSGDIFTSIFV
jgi:subtilisin family serine protease